MDRMPPQPHTSTVIQFGLRGLLLFVMAASVGMAALSAAARAMPEQSRAVFAVLVAIIFAMALLRLAYRVVERRWIETRVGEQLARTVDAEKQPRRSTVLLKMTGGAAMIAVWNAFLLFLLNMMAGHPVSAMEKWFWFVVFIIWNRDRVSALVDSLLSCWWGVGPGMFEFCEQALVVDGRRRVPWKSVVRFEWRTREGREYLDLRLLRETVRVPIPADQKPFLAGIVVPRLPRCVPGSDDAEPAEEPLRM
jgi:hypothetical protein